jgi:hypothetical protein
MYHYRLLTSDMYSTLLAVRNCVVCVCVCARTRCGHLPLCADTAGGFEHGAVGFCRLVSISFPASSSNSLCINPAVSLLCGTLAHLTPHLTMLRPCGSHPKIVSTERRGSAREGGWRLSRPKRPSFLSSDTDRNAPEGVAVLVVHACCHECSGLFWAGPLLAASSAAQALLGPALIEHEVLRHSQR